jgi:cellulose synthase/poly-beta-1,6-N-acetylglucosamine synthase-like glycosyltransferase
MTSSVPEILFWLSVAALFYTYAGYPILLALASRLRPREIRRRPGTPTVSMIIAAYNEERHLAAKLENSLALDYPPGKLEVIVASDGSTDRTDEIASAYALRSRDGVAGSTSRRRRAARVFLHRQPARMGKTAAQNAAVERARGEILLFSDATTHYRRDALRKLLPSFADPTVGCVAGRLIYRDRADSSVGGGARAYWGYETFLKRCESRLGSLIGVSGCLYAVRRSCYVPLAADSCSDFVIATMMVAQGLRAVYEPEAICIEETNQRTDQEFRMRVRIVTRTLRDLWRYRSMLNPFCRGFFAVQLLSHKVLRYLAPLFLIALLIASILLAPQSAFFSAALVAQVGFYALAALNRGTGGGVRPQSRVRGLPRLAALPHYFVLANLASLIGLWNFARGERCTCWEPERAVGAKAGQSPLAGPKPAAAVASAGAPTPRPVRGGKASARPHA